MQESPFKDEFTELIDRKQLEVAEQRLQDAEKEHNEFIQEIATKLANELAPLPPLMDKSFIRQRIDQLFQDKEELQKKSAQLEKKYYELEQLKRDEIESLKKEIESLKVVNQKQATHLERLEQRINSVKTEQAKLKPWGDIVKDIMSLFK